MLGILLLALLLLEVYVLGYLEFISWRTIYTPLCCLMFPYLLVLLISIAVAGHLGFVNFCYSSISVSDFLSSPSQVIFSRWQRTDIP